MTKNGNPATTHIQKTAMTPDEKRGLNDYRAFINLVKAFAIIWIFSYHLFHVKFLMRRFGYNFAKSVIDEFIVNARGPLDYLEGLSILMYLNGHLGVQLFFVTSGFGLYLSYLNRRSTWKTFYAKRAIRIIPLYWLGLFVYYISGVSATITVKELIRGMFFIQAYTSHPLAFGPLWFIGVIVLFYLLFPVFVKAFERPATMWGLAALSLVLPVASSRFLDSLGVAYAGINPTEYIPLFLWGMLLADSISRGTRLHRISLLNPAVSILSLMTFVSLLILSGEHLVPAALAGDTLMSLLIFIGLGAPFLAIRKLPADWAIDFVSRSSYVVFLFHMQWIYWVARISTDYDLVSYSLTENREVYFTSDTEFFFMGIFAILSLIPVSFSLQWAYDRLIVRAFRGHRAAGDRYASPSDREAGML
jgi:peptidoglycan/LPS O-acetylase OafA/YrhL